MSSYTTTETNRAINPWCISSRPNDAEKLQFPHPYVAQTKTKYIEFSLTNLDARDALQGGYEREWFPRLSTNRKLSARQQNNWQSTTLIPPRSEHSPTETSHNVKPRPASSQARNHLPKRPRRRHNRLHPHHHTTGLQFPGDTAHVAIGWFCCRLCHFQSDRSLLDRAGVATFTCDTDDNHPSVVKEPRRLSTGYRGRAGKSVDLQRTGLREIATGNIRSRAGWDKKRLEGVEREPESSLVNSPDDVRPDYGITNRYSVELCRVSCTVTLQRKIWNPM